MALIDCAVCNAPVAVDADRCPKCGTKNFRPPAQIGTVTGFLAIIVVLGMLWIGVSAMTSEDEPPARQQAADPRIAGWYAECERRIREVDPDATIPARSENYSDTGLYVAWPSGHGLVVDGKPSSGSCVVDPGAEAAVTINGRDV